CLTNCWVISGVLLGMGKELELVSMGMAWQMGPKTGVWSAVLIGLLLVTVAASVVPGRVLRRRLASSRWQMASGLAALCGMVLIFVVSTVLGSVKPAHGRAAAATLANSMRPSAVLIVMDTVRA